MLDITVVITNSDGIEDIKGSTQICVGVYSISPIRKHNDIQETVCDMLAAASGLIIDQKDMGRDIGTTDILKTDDSDYIYYAQTLKTDVYSRFAKNRYPQQSRMLTMIFNQDDEGNYEIQDLWIGPSSPAFPGDEYETGNSKTYWKTHALAQNAKMIRSKSITKICPY